MHYAAAKGHLAVVKYLITNGADVKAKTRNGRSPLLLAYENDNFDVAEHLIEKGAHDVSTKDWSLQGALEKCHLNLVNYLIEKGADVNKKDNDGNTPLHCAAKKGNIEVVKYLIGKGARVDIKNGWGETSLHIAAQVNQLEAVKAICKSLLRSLNRQKLLEEFLGIKNTLGKTALAIATKKNWQNIVDYLTQILKEVKDPLFTALKEEQRVDTTFTYTAE